MDMTRRKPVTEDTMRYLVMQRAHELGGIRSAARRWRLSPSFVSDMLKGKRTLSTVVLDDLGYERFVSYRKVEA